MPLSDVFWGDRHARLEEPFGHQWSVATYLRDVSTEEIAAEIGKSCSQP